MDLPLLTVDSPNVHRTKQATSSATEVRPNQVNPQNEKAGQPPTPGNRTSALRLAGPAAQSLPRADEVEPPKASPPKDSFAPVTPEEAKRFNWLAKELGLRRPDGNIQQIQANRGPGGAEREVLANAEKKYSAVLIEKAGIPRFNFPEDPTKQRIENIKQFGIGRVDQTKVAMIAAELKKHQNEPVPPGKLFGPKTMATLEQARLCGANPSEIHFASMAALNNKNPLPQPAAQPSSEPIKTVKQASVAKPIRTEHKPSQPTVDSRVEAKKAEILKNGTPTQQATLAKLSPADQKNYLTALLSAEEAGHGSPLRSLAEAQVKGFEAKAVVGGTSSSMAQKAASGPKVTVHTETRTVPVFDSKGNETGRTQQVQARSVTTSGTMDVPDVPKWDPKLTVEGKMAAVEKKLTEGGAGSADAKKIWDRMSPAEKAQRVNIEPNADHAHKFLKAEASVRPESRFSVAEDGTHADGPDKGKSLPRGEVKNRRGPGTRLETDVEYTKRIEDVSRPKQFQGESTSAYRERLHAINAKQDEINKLEVKSKPYENMRGLRPLTDQETQKMGELFNASQKAKDELATLKSKPLPQSAPPAAPATSKHPSSAAPTRRAGPTAPTQQAIRAIPSSSQAVVNEQPTSVTPSQSDQVARPVAGRQRVGVVPGRMLSTVPSSPSTSVVGSGQPATTSAKVGNNRPTVLSSKVIVVKTSGKQTLATAAVGGVVAGATKAVQTYSQKRTEGKSRLAAAGEAALTGGKEAVVAGGKGAALGLATDVGAKKVGELAANELAKRAPGAIGNMGGRVVTGVAGKAGSIVAATVAAKEIIDIGQDNTLSRDQKDVKELRAASRAAGATVGTGVAGFGVGILVGAGLVSNPVGWGIGIVGGIGLGIAGASAGDSIGTGLFGEKPQMLVSDQDDKSIRESVAPRMPRIINIPTVKRK